MTKKYKKSALVARVSFFLIFLSPLLHAGKQEEQLVQSVLRQVETIAKKSASLEALGKETLTQSSALLDLDGASLAELLKVLNNDKKNWKLRYWITDMLGYVGNLRTIVPLLQLTKDEKEHRLIRLRALDSIVEIARKNPVERKKLRTKLKMEAKRILNQKVKKKMLMTVKKL